MSTCVVLQPSYVPWRGYFHQIQRADSFVFYDDVQYDKHGWRNRNRIKTAAGTQWLTVPVFGRGAVLAGTTIGEVEIRWDPDWSRKQLVTIRQAYARAPFLARYLPLLEAAFEERPARLVDLTIPLTLLLAAELGIRATTYYRSSELRVAGERSERLVEIARHVGATHYLSGPSARNYLDQEKFAAAGITVEFMRYDYPDYPQLHPPFDGAVSILDLLFMVGARAAEYVWEPR